MKCLSDDIILHFMENSWNLFWVVNLEPAVNEEDYQNYRRAAKQHWDMMKQYYEKVRGSKMIIFFNTDVIHLLFHFC